MRSKLPNRRGLETFEFSFDGFTYFISFSRFPNGNPRELFVVCGKPNSPVANMARDLGIAVSVMLQSGMLLSDLQQSLTRNDDGSPAGPLGQLIDEMMKAW